MRLLDEEKGAGALETKMFLSRQFLGGIQMYCIMLVFLIVMAANAEWRGTWEQWRNWIEYWLDRARLEDSLSVKI